MPILINNTGKLLFGLLAINIEKTKITIKQPHNFQLEIDGGQKIQHVVQAFKYLGQVLYYDVEHTKIRLAKLACGRINKTYYAPKSIPLKFRKRIVKTYTYRL